ncbi:MAG: response regulator [Verrucomicrobiales bacterium]
MIVDDHAGMRSTIREICHCPGDSVIELCDGLEALAAYREHSPDWIVMDIEMPGGDGISTTMSILAEDPAARIIIVTQYDDDEIIEAARATGAVACVLKEDLSQLPEIMAGTGAVI